ncbi:MAG TPA: T9SS type A sorting domain-containing protein [Bacteroidia bacterium]|jgi:hypothetical protein|nr:T9SS type A sorting domain-containing protein [Bacteroidia bacterium]
MNYLKKLIRGTLLVSLFATGSLSAQCNGFVRMNGKTFTCGGSNFFPIVLNYSLEISHDATSLFSSRYHGGYATGFANQQPVPITTRAQALAILDDDFQKIKAAGFNTVRVTGPAYGTVRYNWNNPLHTSFPALSAYDLTGNDVQIVDLSSNLQPIFDQIQIVLDAATRANLKVILLAGACDVIPNPSSPSSTSTGYINFLQQLATRYKDNPTLMAVDFYNEPMNGQGDAQYNPALYKKTDVCSLTKSWNDAIKNNSDILTTIGLNSAFTVEAWDPNVVNVDFASFHPYPRLNDGTTGNARNLYVSNDVMDRMKCELYWYKQNVSIPWIIGETGMMARRNDSSYPLNVTGLSTDMIKQLLTKDEQALYLKLTLEACRDYGGSGYSWWVMSEADGNGTAYGIFNGDNALNLKSSNLTGYLTSFTSTPVTTNAVQPPNYFNQNSVGNTYTVSGRILNTSGNPVPNAYVDTWNADWSANLGNTFTDANGYYTLYATGVVKKLKVTATDCSVILDQSLNSSNQNQLTNKNYTLTKIARPTTTALSYANQSISAANVNSYSNDYVTFSNYTINSGTFKTKAINAIYLQVGTFIKNGTFFSAKIGPYYQDCGSLISNGTAFSETALNNTEVPVETSTSIFPNPGNGYYSIRMTEEGTYSIQVYNSYGAQIKSSGFTGTTSELDLSESAAGIYMLIIKDAANKSYSFKLIKQ